MSDTLGGLVDKLQIVNLKMWNNQELLYELRRMSFDEFKEKYFKTEDGAEKLWACLKKACDLNIQRNELIDDIDVKFVQGLELTQYDNDDKFDNLIQRKHKTY